MAARASDIRCEETAELLPAYVLDALTPDDASRIEAHVADCAHCREELAGYRRIAERMQQTAPAADDAGRREVDRSRAPARTDHPDADTGNAAPAGAPLEDGRPNVDGAPAPRGFGWAVRLGQRLNEPQKRWSISAVTVTLLLTVALLGTNLYWAVTISVLRSDRQDLTALVQSQEAVLETAASGGRVVLLREGEAAPGAVGTMTMDATGDRAVLVVTGLPRQPLGMAYQLWLIDDGERESGGLFTVDAEGRGVLHVEGHTHLDTYEAFGVTLEPEAGSSGPTSPPVLGGGA